MSKHGIDRHEYSVRAREFSARGEQSGRSKLTDAIVRDIRATHGSVSSREWARRTGVAKRTIERVRDYSTWRHIA